MYPTDNFLTFERWFLENWSVSDRKDRMYLPIQWTALYCNNNYGSKSIVNSIQKFIDTLDKTKKYYTIVQYDDGILNDLSKLDIKIIGMSGGHIDYPIPLLCQKHKFDFNHLERDIHASFIGTLTHSVRHELIELYKDVPGWYMSSKSHSLKEYCEILARSEFVLCPRGYGKSSFRIQEAIDFGAIPVYISDEFILPYNMQFKCGLLLKNSFINTLPELLNKFTELTDITTIDENNKKDFTYPGCKERILNYLNTCDEMQ